MSTETASKRRYSRSSHTVWCRTQEYHLPGTNHGPECTAAYRATLATPATTETPKRERKRRAVAPNPADMTVSELTVALSDAWESERAAASLLTAAQLHRNTLQGEVRRRREVLAKLDETDPLISTTLPAQD